MKIGLNLGCGTRIFKSTTDILWHNMDAVAGPHVDVVDDWRNLSAHWQSDIDLIVAFHTFEHQGCGEQPIRQCYDVLRTGGSLIVCVPDLRKLAKWWLASTEPDVLDYHVLNAAPKELLSTQVFMTNVFGPYDGTEESRHRWGFDEQTLRQQMIDTAPWRTVSQFNYRPLPGAEIPRDDRWMLCLEGLK